MTEPIVDRPWRRRATFLLIGLALSFALRAQTFAIGLGFDPDEGVSMLQGRALVAGTLPYVTYFDNRQPLLYANFAVAQVLFGERVVASRIWANVSLGVAAALLGLIVRRLVAGGWPAWAAMALLLALSMAAVPVGLSEAFVLPWTALAVLLALRAADARSARARLLWTLASGLALGVGAEVKLLALAEGLALLAAFHFGRRRDDGVDRPPLRPRDAVALLVVLGVGVAVPTLVIGAIYAAAGHFSTFVYASFTYNRRYGATTTFEPIAFAKFLAIFGAHSLALVPPIVAAIVVARRGPHAAALRVALVWTLAAFVGTCATKRFYAHYSLTLVPPLCLAAAAGFAAMRSLAPRRRTLLAVTTAICCVPFVVAFVARRQAIAGLERVEGPVAQAIAAQTRPGDVVFLGNHDPAHYYASRTEPATYWIFPLWIGDEQWLRVSNLDARAELRRILESRPRLISYTRRIDGWDAPTVAYFAELMSASPDYERTSPPGQHFEVYVRRP